MRNVINILIVTMLLLNNFESVDSGVLDSIADSVVNYITYAKNTVKDFVSKTGKYRVMLKRAGRKILRALFDDMADTNILATTTTKKPKNKSKIKPLPLRAVTRVVTTTEDGSYDVELVPLDFVSTMNPAINQYNIEKRDISALQTYQIIVSHGFKVESHVVFTKDGFILDIYRILNPISKEITKKNKLFILQHGLMGSSDDWLILGEGKSLPYILLELGYEVWLSNARGNKYTKSTNDYRKDNKDFWDFSFHEIGTIDLPAVIDYVKRLHNDIEIHCIGHSLGGSAFLVLLSSLPQYNKILKSVTLLAPLAYLSSAKGPLKSLAEMYAANNENFIGYIGAREIYSISNYPKNIVNMYCPNNHANTSFACINPLLFLSGDNYSVEKHNLRNILGHVPTGMSAKTLLHLLQLVNSGRFQLYDYGELTNSLTYRNKIPAKYMLSNINTTVYIFSSSGDWLATPLGIVELLNKLPEVAVHEVVATHDFGHTDFVWGDTAALHVYSTLVDIYNNQKTKS